MGGIPPFCALMFGLIPKTTPRLIDISQAQDEILLLQKALDRVGQHADVHRRLIIGDREGIGIADQDGRGVFLLLRA